LDCCYTGLPQAKHRLGKGKKKVTAETKQAGGAKQDGADEAGVEDSDEGPPTDVEVA
jgi:hypothetical protein